MPCNMQHHATSCDELRRNRWKKKLSSLFRFSPCQINMGRKNIMKSFARGWSKSESCATQLQILPRRAVFCDFFVNPTDSKPRNIPKISCTVLHSLSDPISPPRFRGWVTRASWISQWLNMPCSAAVRLRVPYINSATNYLVILRVDRRQYPYSWKPLGTAFKRVCSSEHQTSSAM